jgi:SAM-dependent methyltransferase
MFNPSFNKFDLPPGAESFLRHDNPRLKELQDNYRSLRHQVIDPSQWTDKYVNREVNLQYFRGDFAYVWQHRDLNADFHYALAAYYIKSIDTLGLLNLLEEDNLFGTYTLKLDNGLTISRDLLDSIVEIYFLERNIAISSLGKINILDIGAGYGRLAYRLVKSLPNIGKVFCADAVAVSTFISEYYLRFRGVDKQAVVVPLYQLDEVLAENPIDLAISVHCLSECTLNSIIGWLDILDRHKIKHLMVVPNDGSTDKAKLLTYEKNGEKINFLPIVNSKGYKLIVCKPKYLDATVQKYGVSPTYYYLFEKV